MSLVVHSYSIKMVDLLCFADIMWLTALFYDRMFGSIRHEKFQYLKNQVWI